MRYKWKLCRWGGVTECQGESVNILFPLTATVSMSWSEGSRTPLSVNHTICMERSRSQNKPRRQPWNHKHCDSRGGCINRHTEPRAVSAWSHGNFRRREKIQWHGRARLYTNAHVWKSLRAHTQVLFQDKVFPGGNWDKLFRPGKRLCLES